MTTSQKSSYDEINLMKALFVDLDGRLSDDEVRRVTQECLNHGRRKDGLVVVRRIDDARTGDFPSVVQVLACWASDPKYKEALLIMNTSSWDDNRARVWRADWFKTPLRVGQNCVAILSDGQMKRVRGEG